MPNCEYDYLEIKVGAGAAVKYCGTEAPEAIDTTHDAGISFKFSTDYSVSGEGFWLQYWKLIDGGHTPPTEDPNVWPACDGDIDVREEPGTIETAHYPEYYQPFADCRWRLTAEQGKAVQVEFEDFAVEPHPSCETDHLLVYDGEDQYSPLLARLCGTDLPKPITSSGRYMFLHFESDATVGYRGFRAQYSWVNEPPTVPPSEVCEPDYFPCVNGKCVPLEAYCNGMLECEDSSDEDYCEELNSECGRPEIEHFVGNQFQSGSRIVGGTVVRPGSWPWMAYMGDLFGGQLVCGGALIEKKHVLTSAYCGKILQDSMLPTTVSLGKYERQITGANEQTFLIDKIWIHENYNATSHDNDIAIVRLNNDAVINSYVIPICLPRRRQEIFRGRGAYVTGWGETLETGGESFLKQAWLQVIDRDTCNHQTYHDGTVTYNMLCAADAEWEHDLCHNDEGGPLVAEYGYGFKIIGVATQSDMCATPLKPRKFTRVSQFIDWIEARVAELASNGQNRDRRIRKH